MSDVLNDKGVYIGRVSEGESNYIAYFAGRELGRYGHKRGAEAAVLHAGALAKAEAAKPKAVRPTMNMTAAKRNAILLDGYRRGDSFMEIAHALGTTEKSARAMLTKRRALGEDIPHRQDNAEAKRDIILDRWKRAKAAGLTRLQPGA